MGFKSGSNPIFAFPTPRTDSERAWLTFRTRKTRLLAKWDKRPDSRSKVERRQTARGIGVRSLGIGDSEAEGRDLDNLHFGNAMQKRTIIHCFQAFA